jgi:ectoine hydroxylase-related dioxygenase (phytanoyl-CoA dioxygenase family)
MYVKDLSQTKYGVSNVIKPSANRTWITPNNPDHFYRGGVRSVQIFQSLQEERRQRYPGWDQKITEDAQEIAKVIEQQGYYKIENFWDTAFLDKIRKQTFETMEQNDPTKVKHPQDGRHTQVIHPLENIELTNEMAVNETIQSIATAFLNCPPALGTTNLRLSTAERSTAAGTNMFHKDFNSPIRLIKFFTYFDDVTMKNGPFTYVHGSNRELPSNPHWSSQHRWPDEAIKTLYGADRIKNLTANYGDLLIATTNGFHKGLKLEEGSRLMFTLNYVIHAEVGGSGFAGPPQNLHTVKDSTYQNLDDNNKRLYDFVEKV